MSDLILGPVASGYNLSKIDSNFSAIEAKINADVLQVSGGHNTMSQALDMNGQELINAGPVHSNNFILNGASIQPKLVSITDAVLTDDLASTASGKGAALVGFQQSGTGAVAQIVYDKLRQRVSVFDFMTTEQIADVQAKTALVDVTLALQAAIDFAETVGGCEMYCPHGIYRITNTLNVGLLGFNSVQLVGDGPGLESGDGGSTAATIIQWWGATAGGSKMLVQQGVTSWGMRGLALDGRYRPGYTNTANKPDYAVVLDRTQYSNFENIRITGWMRCGIYIQPITSNNNDNCMFNRFTNVSITGYHPSGVAMELHGNATSWGGTELHTSNVCHNTFVQTTIVYAKYGIDVYDADNNSFLMTRVSKRPEATDPNPWGVFLRGANSRALYFFHLQVGLLYAGPYSTAIIYGFDKENGAPNPTIDATAKVMWTSHGNNAQGFVNDSFFNNVNILVNGDPILGNSNKADGSLVSIFNRSTGARVCFGTVNSPRAINMYTHGSATPNIPAIQFGNDTILNYQLGNKTHSAGSGAPTAGAHYVGEVQFNTGPVAGGTLGWVCTATGTPGTWKTWGQISA